MVSRHDGSSKNHEMSFCRHVYIPVTNHLQTAAVVTVKLTLLLCAKLIRSSTEYYLQNIITYNTFSIISYYWVEFVTQCNSSRRSSHSLVTKFISSKVPRISGCSCFVVTCDPSLCSLMNIVLQTAYTCAFRYGIRLRPVGHGVALCHDIINL